MKFNHCQVGISIRHFVVVLPGTRKTEAISPGFQAGVPCGVKYNHGISKRQQIFTYFTDLTHEGA